MSESPVSDRECSHSRLIDAPPKRVFEGNTTRVGWRQVFDTAAHRHRVAPVVSQANEQHLDRLADEVGRVG